MSTKEATDVLMVVLGKFYKKLTEHLTPDELQALSARVKEETLLPFQVILKIFF